MEYDDSLRSAEHVERKKFTAVSASAAARSTESILTNEYIIA